MIVGFRDALDVRVPFEDVMAGAGDFRTKSGAVLPRPLVRMLARQYTPHDADYYGLGADVECISVTGLIKPVQISRLEQRHDIYVRPLDGMWAAYGTMMHLMLEAGADPDAVHAERQYTMPLADTNGLHIGGTIDLIEDGSGTDWKVTSAYKVKNMLKAGVYKSAPDYFWQAQLYAMLARAHGHTIDRWQIVAVCRDWSARQHGAVIDMVEVVDVPLIAPERVANYMRQQVTVYVASALCEDGGLPDCTDEETWQGRRCAQYCDAAPFCHQIHPGLTRE